MVFNGRVSDATTVLRWTAGSGSARSATFVMLRLCSLRRLRLAAPAFFVVATVIFFWSYDQSYSAATRWWNAAFNAAVYAVGFSLCRRWCPTSRLRRALGARLRPGNDFTATWDDDSVSSSAIPWPERTRIQRTAISRVRRLGDWTAFQQPGVKAWSVAAPLFPETEVAALRS